MRLVLVLVVIACGGVHPVEGASCWDWISKNTEGCMVSNCSGQVCDDSKVYDCQYDMNAKWHVIESCDAGCATPDEQTQWPRASLFCHSP